MQEEGVFLGYYLEKAFSLIVYENKKIYLLTFFMFSVIIFYLFLFKM